MPSALSQLADTAAGFGCSQRRLGPVSFNANNKYRAQWEFYTPPGYIDEAFDVPFSFTVPKDGAIHRMFTAQLDDDAPYHARGLYCTILGFAMLYDSYNRQVFDQMAWNFGGWGAPATNTSSAVGWPIDAELICPPGGTLTFDFQFPNAGGTTTVIGAFMGIKRRKDC